jgi:CheY-like chemotaxis protein
MEPHSNRIARLVLVVDDSHDYADAFCEALVLSSDWQALAAYAVSDGVRCARSDRPDAVLTDLDLAPSSGFALAAALEREFAAGDMPVLIAMTGNAVLLQAASQNRRFARTIMKPAEPGQLVGCLSQLVPARHGH